MAIAKQAEQRVGRVLEAASRWLAYLGGSVLTVLALVTVVSIVGRYLIALGLGPVKGDFELVEAGCAVAIFAFLPWAQMKRAHVTVDIFISRLPHRAQAALGLAGDALMALAAGVILWRLWLGLGEKFPYGPEGLRAAIGFGPKPFFIETTYELEFPVWIPYAGALIGAALFFVVSLYSVWRALNWVIEGQEEML